MRCGPPRSASRKYFSSSPGRRNPPRKRKLLLRERVNEKRLAHLAQGNAQLFCFADCLHIAFNVRSNFWVFLLDPVAGLSAVQHGSADARRNVSDEYAGRNHASSVWQHTGHRAFYYSVDYDAPLFGGEAHGHNRTAYDLADPGRRSDPREMACGDNDVRLPSATERAEYRFSFYVQSSGLEADPGQLSGSLFASRGFAGVRNIFLDPHEESNHCRCHDVLRLPVAICLWVDWRIQQRNMGTCSRVLIGVHAYGIVHERNSRLEGPNFLRDSDFCRTLSDGALDRIAALEVVIEYRVVEGATNKVRGLRYALHRRGASGCDRSQRARGPLRQVLRRDGEQTI